MSDERVADEQRWGTVRFAGPFTEAERTALARQFGHCRLELIARSSVDPRIALVVWRPDEYDPSGPRPLAATPGWAAYVLDGGAAAGMTPVPVRTTAELHHRFAGHFDLTRLSPPMGHRLRAHFSWRWLLPLLAALVAAIWLLLVYRLFSAG